MSSNAHKPSEKHTLDEVLKSLQDLMRGELLQDAPSPPPPPKPHYGKVGRPRKVPKPPVEQTALAPTHVSAPVDVGAVLASLRSLVSHELAPETGAAQQSRPSISPDTAVTENESPDTSSPAPATELLDVAQELTQADEALSDLPDSAAALDSEPNPETTHETTQLVETVAPVAVNAPPSEQDSAIVMETAAIVANEVAATEAPPAEPFPPPEGAQQELPFGEIPSTATDRTEALSLEMSPIRETTTLVGTTPEAALDEAKATGHEARDQHASGEKPPGIDNEETFDAALAVPADDDEAKVLDFTQAESEEIVLEAASAPDDEPPDATIALTIENDGDASHALPTSPIVPPEPDESTASTSAEFLVNFDAIDAVSPVVPTGDQRVSATDTQPLDPTPDSAHVPSLEIEVAEAPGSSIDFERSEPPAPASVQDESALGSLGGHLEVDLGDLPILQDVVVPPPAAGQLNLIEPPLPAADRARQLAVRVAARLNIERRKRGEPGIDTKTIHRLQQLLREELEKAGAKSENTPKP